MYQDHISYFQSVHILVSDGFTVINFPISPGYILSVKTLAPILYQTMAFENDEVTMTRQVISNRFYASAVKLSSALWQNSLKC